MSKVRFLDVVPRHFITRIANPYTRYGDKPYVVCKGCNRITTNLGLTAHQRACHAFLAKKGKKK